MTTTIVDFPDGIWPQDDGFCVLRRTALSDQRDDGSRRSTLTGEGHHWVMNASFIVEDDDIFRMDAFRTAGPLQDEIIRAPDFFALETGLFPITGRRPFFTGQDIAADDIAYQVDTPPTLTLATAASVGDTSVSVTASAVGQILPAGTRIALGNHLYEVARTFVMPIGAAAADLHVLPAVRSASAQGAALEISRPEGLWVLAEETEMTRERLAPRLYQYSIELIENFREVI